MWKTRSELPGLIKLDIKYNIGMLRRDVENYLLKDFKDSMEEGCLSVPGFYESVERPKKIKILTYDYDGNKIEFDANGLLSTCIQHEIDHLNGKLFVDHISSLKRSRIETKIKKLKKDGLIASRKETPNYKSAI